MGRSRVFKETELKAGYVFNRELASLCGFTPLRSARESHSGVCIPGNYSNGLTSLVKVVNLIKGCLHLSEPPLFLFVFLTFFLGCFKTVPFFIASPSLTTTLASSSSFVGGGAGGGRFEGREEGGGSGEGDIERIFCMTARILLSSALTGWVLVTSTPVSLRRMKDRELMARAMAVLTSAMSERGRGGGGGGRGGALTEEEWECECLSLV